MLLLVFICPFLNVVWVEFPTQSNGCRSKIITFNAPMLVSWAAICKSVNILQEYLRWHLEVSKIHRFFCECVFYLFSTMCENFEGVKKNFFFFLDPLDFLTILGEGLKKFSKNFQPPKGSNEKKKFFLTPSKSQRSSKIMLEFNSPEIKKFKE